MRLSKLAEAIEARFIPRSAADAEIEIRRVAPLNQAGEDALSFIASEQYARYLKDTTARALISKVELQDCPIPQLIHDNPYYAFAKAAQLFHKEDHGFQGISEKAFCHPSAEIGEGVTLFPFCYIGKNAKVARGAVIYAGVYIGQNAVIGEESVIYPNATIGEGCLIGRRVKVHAGTVIGADGFGFAKGKDDIQKIPQTGIVVVEDDVEIGAVCTIDRATLGETRIRRGTKFDSKVHIGHNVEVGEHCLFSALTGVAGSTKIGNWVTAGGNAGFNGHIEVKDGVTVGAKAGVTASIGPGGVYMGFPAVPAGQWRRQHVYVKRLPDYEKRVKELEERLARLEARPSS